MSTSSRLREKLVNVWVEYSGGSRPRTNMVRFGDDQYGEHLEIRYVFDWDTHEEVYFNFTLNPGDIDAFLDHLLNDGYALLRKTGQNEHLLVECELSEGRIKFKVDARGYGDLNGTNRYLLDSYRDLLIDDLSLDQ